MNEGVFQRHEIKYLLNSRQRSALQQALPGRMEADEYGENTICSLYYDTPDSLLVRRSLEKPVYKEKLRLRSYGKSTPETKIYVELKKKYDGIVYKRRISMSEADATSYLAGKIPPVDQSQIGREIEHVRRFYGDLRPAMYLCYDRIAYFCPEDAGLRLTLDRNILWRTSALSLNAAPRGEALLSPDQSLLEIKTASAIPLWLVAILRENGIRHISFSKYGTAYTITQKNKFFLKGGSICA